MLPVSATQGPLSSLQLGFAGLTKYLAKVKGVGPVCFSIIVFGDGPEDFGNGAVGYQTGLKSASLRHLGRGNCHASSALARALRSINKSWLGLLSAFDPLRTLAPYGRLHARLKFINASAWLRCVRSSSQERGQFMMWRKKELPLSEWAAFQKRFAEFQMMLLSHPDLAMFCTGDSDGDKEIFITGLYIHVIEEASPGGWKDCEKPSGERVSLLVGAPDSWDRLGVRPAPA